MKSSIILSFLVSLFFLSCRKENDPKLPDLTRVPTPLLTKDATGDAVISGQDPASFAGKVIVDLFFETDIKPQKVDVVVIKNGDKTNVKTIQADVTTFPSTVNVTGSQLESLFGEPIKLGDNFDIGADITTISGQIFQAFPTVGNGYGAGVLAQPGASVTVRFSAVCEFDPQIYQGDFEVVEDGWADYHAGDVIQLTLVDATHVSFEYAANNAKPIVVEIDPLSNATSAELQEYGDYGPCCGNLSAVSVDGSPANFVAPCDGILSIKLEHISSTLGSFGEATIVLKKK